MEKRFVRILPEKKELQYKFIVEKFSITFDCHPFFEPLPGLEKKMRQNI